MLAAALAWGVWRSCQCSDLRDRDLEANRKNRTTGCPKNKFRHYPLNQATFLCQRRCGIASVGASQVNLQLLPAPAQLGPLSHVCLAAPSIAAVQICGASRVDWSKPQAAVREAPGRAAGGCCPRRKPGALARRRQAARAQIASHLGRNTLTAFAPCAADEAAGGGEAARRAAQKCCRPRGAQPQRARRQDAGLRPRHVARLQALRVAGQGADRPGEAGRGGGGAVQGPAVGPHRPRRRHAHQQHVALPDGMRCRKGGGDSTCRRKQRGCVLPSGHLRSTFFPY